MSDELNATDCQNLINIVGKAQTTGPQEGMVLVQLNIKLGAMAKRLQATDSPNPSDNKDGVTTE